MQRRTLVTGVLAAGMASRLAAAQQTGAGERPDDASDDAGPPRIADAGKRRKLAPQQAG